MSDNPSAPRDAVSSLESDAYAEAARDPLADVAPRVLLDQSPGPFMLLSPDWRYSYVNPAAATRLGRSVASLQGQVIWDLYPTSVGNSFYHAYHRVMEGRVAESVEAHFPLWDRWYSAYCYPAGDGIGVFWEDVTERRRNDRALAESARELARAQELARTGSWRWRFPSDEVVWSSELYRLLGVDPTAYTPTFESLADWIDPDDLARFRTAVDASLTHDVPYAIELRLRRADHTALLVNVVGEVTRGENGEPLEMFGTMQDISKQRREEHLRLQREQQLQHSQKFESLGMLAGGLAHEFNNLLVGVLGNASLVLQELPADRPERAWLEDIERAAHRAANLTKQMLAFAGKGQLVIETVDLALLVPDMVGLLRAALPCQSGLTIELSSTPVLVEGDASQLRQLAVNLITNACEASDGATEAVVLRLGAQLESSAARPIVVHGGRALPTGRYHVFEVEDRGSGMGADTLEHLFEPFFSTKFAGRGLGLAASNGIATGHGGGIEIESALGRGTRVRVLLPVAQDPALVVTPLGAVATWRGTGEVLVVDDEDAVRLVVRRLLERRGFHVTEFACGEAAVEVLMSQEHPRLVVLDLTMPGMGGAETLRRIRQLAPHLPVLLMSGYTFEAAPTNFSGEGPAEFLEKPFRADEFYRAVARALEHAASEGATLST